MFFFLLVVMVPKMKPKTVCAGRLFKTEANVLTGSLELGDCMAILWKGFRVVRSQKRVPYGCVNGRCRQKWNTHFLMNTKFIFQGWKHLHFGDGQLPGRRDKHGHIHHLKNPGILVATRWKPWRFERVSPVSTGVPGEWFGGHWWLLQSRGFSRGVWNLNAASPYFSMEKTQGKKTGNATEVAICPRGQWNEGRNLFLFGSDLELHDFWQRFFCLLPSVIHQQAPCFRSMRPGYLGAFPSDGCATWTNHLRFKTLTWCLPVPWYVLKQLKHIHFTQHIYIYTHTYVYTHLCQVYTCIHLWDVILDTCFTWVLVTCGSDKHFLLRSSKQDWWNEDII